MLVHLHTDFKINTVHVFFSYDFINKIFFPTLVYHKNIVYNIQNVLINFMLSVMLPVNNGLLVINLWES